MSATRAASTALSVALFVVLALGGSAGAAPASPGARHTVAKRAPSGPPLSSMGSPGAGESTAGVPSSEGDPLIDNGLSSPLCKGSVSGGLSRAAQDDCQTSGFVAAPAPTKSYEIDVNIDVGPLGLSKGGLLSVIQDIFVTPVWNALVWVVHALVVTVVKLNL